MYKQIKSEVNVIVQYLERKNKLELTNKSGLIEQIALNIIHGNIELSITKRTANNRRVFVAANIETQVYLRVLSDYLKNYSDNLYTDRRTAIQRIENDSISKRYTHVMKLDVRDFYNSIDIEILKKLFLEKRNFYKVEYLNILDQYYEMAEEYSSILPGLSPSNILAEIYGLKLDKLIKQYLNNKYITFSYIRYVDDIFIYLDKDVDLRDISAIFNELKLKLNNEKSKIVELEIDSTVNYLGYEFNYVNQEIKSISISEDKYGKILRKLDRLITKYFQKSEQGYVSVVELDTWFYSIYKHIMYTRVYKKNNSMIYTGFAHSYVELYNEFGIDLKRDTAEKPYIDSKVSREISKLKRDNHHFFTENKKFTHMLPSNIIKKKKKIIFLDDKIYFNRRKIIKFLKIHYNVLQVEGPNLEGCTYYQLTSLYHEEIKKVLDI